MEYHRELREKGLDIPDLDHTFYGMTEFRFDDPDGNRLWIGESKRDRFESQAAGLHSSEARNPGRLRTSSQVKLERCWQSSASR